MFVAMGIGAYTAGMFHVMTHAFFKALLFLGSGTVIHALNGEQDVTNMGGLRKYLPGTHLMFFIATFAISGIAPLAGFFSKDEILLHAFETNTAVWAVMSFCSVLTAFYMGRVLFLTFWGNYRGDAHNLEHLHKPALSMTAPLAVLCVLTVVGGFAGIPEVFGLGKPVLHEFLAPVLAVAHHTHAAEAMNAGTEFGLMGLAMGLGLAALGFAFSRFANATQVENAAAQTGIKGFLGNKWRIDEMYDTIVNRPLNFLSVKFHSVIENDIIDGVIGSVGNFVLVFSRLARILQGGAVSGYLTMMIGGILVILAAWVFGR